MKVASRSEKPLHSSAMSNLLIEVAVRLVNTLLGAIVFTTLLRGQRVLQTFGMDYDDALLVALIMGAAIGLLWGKQIWAYADRKFAGKWARRGR
jgi:hypothetical protein